MTFHKQIINAVQELLFPVRCLGCERQLASRCPPLLCADCLDRAIRITHPVCTCCGTPFPSGQDHLCGVCLRNYFAFSKARSLFFYQEPISTLLLRLKFGGILTGLSSLSELAKKAEANIGLRLAEPDLLLPVPLHIQRLRKRGFNQSLLLARACFPHWREKIRLDLLHRHQSTLPQIRLSGKARRNNLKKAFSVRNPHELAGKNILLVDDVFTTGSTLHECAR
ncbi:MAG: ComF family protein, partial [Candidatus Electrothrix sp. AR4]|nr:ComF family protein [Candidatus Electrothrix sp. AR4]